MAIRNGSKFIEIDTGKTYLYDEENAHWIEQGSSGGSGGGGSSDFSTATVTVELNEGVDVWIRFPVITDDGIMVNMINQSTLSETYTVPLYNGKTTYYDDDYDYITITGNASKSNDDENITITGDCTISYNFEMI